MDDIPSKMNSKNYRLVAFKNIPISNLAKVIVRSAVKSLSGADYGWSDEVAISIPVLDFRDRGNRCNANAKGLLSKSGVDKQKSLVSCRGTPALFKFRYPVPR